MPLDFPASPTDGQVYGNWIYSTSKGAWQAKPLVSAKTVTSDVPPSSPANGDQWFNTVDSTLYIYYTDVDGSQWVESRAPIISDGYYSPNYIINGAFDFWQRGTSFASPASGAYNADRWQVYWDGTGTRTISRQTFTAGSAPVPGYEGTFFYRFAQTTAGTGGTFNNFLNQPIESVRSLAGEVVTVSFWAKADATRTVTPNMEQNFGTGGSPSAIVNTSGTPISLTTSWTRYSQTFSIPSISGKTLGTNGNHVLRFILASATNNATQTIDIWGVQVEEGSVATPFRRNANSIQGELAACQRYYVRFSGPSTGTIYGHAVSTATANSARAYVPLNTSMRIVPTSVEFSTVQSWWAANSSTITALVITAQSTISIVDLSATTSNSPSPGQFGLLIGNGSNSFIAFSAEL
jgi:hypothetical protein